MNTKKKVFTCNSKKDNRRVNERTPLPYVPPYGFNSQVHYFQHSCAHNMYSNNLLTQTLFKSSFFKVYAE